MQMVATIASDSSDEMERARKVQARLLRGKPPLITSLEYAGCSIPALGVGGDFYDFLDLGPGQPGLVLGDVCGKGISAALMMAALQATLRSHCSAGITEIPRLLRSVNRLFYDSTNASHFASLFVAQYHEASHSIGYANCGHHPPFIVRKHGAVERLGPTATILGAFDDWDCKVKDASLCPGDILLVFSDGVTEAMDGTGVEFGEGRLLDLLSGLCHLSADSLVETLAASVCAFSSGVEQDDMTLVVARPVSRRD